MKSAKERLSDWGCEGVMILENYSYDDALIGVTEDNRAVYDFDKMVDWLCEKEGLSVVAAIEWIEYNTIRALPYAGAGAPVILYRLEDLHGKE